jgi:hypothetical protein
MVRRVAQFNTMHGNIACPVPSQLGSVAYPFLAPALMEALRASEYAGATRIVPGEADDYCACYAQDNPRSIIFTGDTDLLLYDYPKDTLISFLKDGTNVPGPALKVYSPSQICQQLNLKSLVQLGYAIHNDRWRALKESVLDARTYDKESSLFLDFRKRYTDQVVTPPYSSGRANLEAALQGLDARISEYVLQALCLGHPSLVEPPLALFFFLPLLFEDPLRSSAWISGRDIRLLAYSLVTPNRFIVQEHVRKAQGVSVEELSIPGQKQQIETARATKDAIAAPAINEDSASSRYWLLVALQLALRTISPPHIALASRVVLGEFDNTWAYVHLLANVQAVLYSLRILKQCIAVRLAFDSDSEKTHTNPLSPSLSTIISELSNALASFPTISKLFSVPGRSVRTPTEEPELQNTLKEIYARAGVADGKYFEEPKSKRSRKRQRREEKAGREAPKGASADTSRNIFAILDANG